MPRSRALVVALLVVLAALPGLAYASPPDPSWISGLYDDADFDDVIILVASATGTVGPDLLVAVRPILPVVRRASDDRVDVKHSRPASPDLPRAPPAA